jgi:non-ribosomal peptide synthetase component E (peptide arylation enzyme)
VIVPSDPGTRLDMAAVQEFLDGRGLMRQKWPEQLEFLSELPRAPAGKVLKQELKKRFASLQEATG